MKRHDRPSLRRSSAMRLIDKRKRLKKILLVVVASIACGTALVAAVVA